MDTFNEIVAFWQLLFGVSVGSFLYGLIKSSWKFMFISFMTFLPVAYYFLGVNNSWKLVGYIPVLLLLLSIILWKKQGRFSR